MKPTPMIDAVLAAVAWAWPVGAVTLNDEDARTLAWEWGVRYEDENVRAEDAEVTLLPRNPDGSFAAYMDVPLFIEEEG